MGTEYALVDHTDKEFIWLGSKYYSSIEKKGWLFQINNKRIVDFIGRYGKIGHSFELVIGDNFDEAEYRQVDTYVRPDDSDENFEYSDLRN